MDGKETGRPQAKRGRRIAKAKNVMATSLCFHIGHSSQAKAFQKVPDSIPAPQILVTAADPML
jgi:hypothetical protein